MLLRSHGVTDIGRVRPKNEDRILFDDTLGLYVVCDGIGGRRRGEVAAEIATHTIRRYVESSGDPMEVTWPYGFNVQLSLAANRLLTAAKVANRQVWRRSEESLEYLGMGTTVCAVLVDANLAAVVNIGDSRVYLLRNGFLEQLSVDDTIVGASMATREFVPDEFRYPPIRNILTRAAGSQENVEVHLKELQLEEGDRILLTSDGLHGLIPDDRLQALLLQAGTPSEAATALIAAAHDAGAPDNMSAIVVEYQTGETAP